MIRKPILLAFIINILFCISIEGKERLLTDEMGRKVKISNSPKRIVSLAPSITEILFTLGLREEIVGVTDFCDYPEAALKKPKIGGFINPDMERILSLKPDLIIGTRDGNRMETVQRLADLGFPVYLVDPRTFNGVLRTIENMGEVTGKGKEARKIMDSMRRKKEDIVSLTQSRPRPRVFFQVGYAPITTVGRDTLSNNLLFLAGGKNVSENESSSYPVYSIEAVMSKAPEIIIISSMERKRDYSNLLRVWQNWKSIPAVRANAIHVIDSNRVDRPTSRIGEGLEALARIIHPEAFQKKVYHSEWGQRN